MTELPLNCRSESDQKAIREQLDRILKSGPFLHAPRRQRFLEYIVNETLAGRGERLKGYSIAQEVFDRSDAFDPNVDPIVRVEAARVRDKLREYYEVDGRSDPIRIDLPKGSYTPHMEFRQAPTPEPGSEQLETVLPDRQPDPIQAPAALMDERPSSTPHWLKRLIRWQMAVPALALLLVLGAVGAWRWSSRSVSPLSEKASIAVLPFENIGNDSKWDHFADGITEDIVTDLSHSKDLFVVARNSTEVYKGKPEDVRNVGRDLGVHYALVGSIQPSGAQISGDCPTH